MSVSQGTLVKAQKIVDSGGVKVVTPDQEWSVKGIKSNGMPVVRLRSLSGGNFWGLPTRPDIAESMKEIFARNFQTSFGNGVVDNLKDKIPKLSR